jgi:hypothetical protein
VRYLLANNAPVLAVVPATRIFAGAVPINTVLPAISVEEVDTVERNTIAMNTPTVMHHERVRATVHAKTYPSQKSILALVRKACPHQRGTINTVVVDSIVPAGKGPDIFDEAAVLYMQSRDFIVTWRAS